MRFTTIFAAAIGGLNLVNATPVANAIATSALASQDLRGGYYDDPQCYLKGHFNPNIKSPYGTYDGAQCPPQVLDPHKVYATTMDLNNCLLNVNGQLKWLPRGGTFASCRDCASKQFQTNILTNNYDKGGNNFISTTIDLNEGIYQEGGRLKCWEIEGTLTIL